MTSRIRVLLVDDNDEFLEGISDWLNATANLEVVGRADNGERALQEVQRLTPDLVLTDFSMSDMNGFEVARKIKMEPDAPKVLIVSFHDSESLQLEAFAAGADGMVDKASVIEQLLPAILKLFPEHARERSARAVKNRPRGERDSSRETLS
jgi:DNA-binding NarL/FixJ family response regulator